LVFDGKPFLGILDCLYPVAVHSAKPFFKIYNSMKFGIYRFHEVIDDTGITAVETECGLPVTVISVYRAWSHCNIQDDQPWLEHLKGCCRDLLLTWEPWHLPVHGGRPEEQPEFSLREILSGRYDDYIRSFSKALSEFTQRIYLRPLHEMNGNWYPWCGKVNNNTVELYVPAWHHIHNLVCENVRSNIQWVWSPYATSCPDDPENAIERYFPGDDAIDWIAMDGYNWGDTLHEGGWSSFEQIFENAYKTITAISSRPLMISEIACAENGGDKARWIKQTFKSLTTSFHLVKLLIWFDAKKECDWRMASSSRALNAFRKIGEERYIV
jgi:mannan endo-1,4-beta-mannosidase